jgi:uncharacterized membrane protein
MSYTSEQQTRIDAYLMKLRRSLGDLRPEDVNEILREIRGHILERAEASGEVTNDRLVEILKDLGRPEDIGPLYQAEAMVARARSSFSPALILRTTMRWAMMSVRGFVVFLAGLVGYGMSFGFLLCAILKPFMPDQVGAWVSPAGFSIGTVTPVPNAHEVLGWWLIPFCLVAGALALVLTTRILRWTLRFAIPPGQVGFRSS